MDDAESLSEADDTLEDDCTCAPGCDHEHRLRKGEWVLSCDPACPVHGEVAHTDKFTWAPGDVTLVDPDDPG